MELCRGVHKHRMSKPVFVAARAARRKLLAQRGLYVEIAPPFAESERGLNDGEMIGESGVAGGNAELQEARRDVISLLFIGACQAIFDQQRRPIPPSLRQHFSAI